MRLFLALIIIYSCGRPKDSDELVLSEDCFEDNGIYYSFNCAKHSNYTKYSATDTCYHNNGKIKSTFTIRNGLPEGHWEQFNLNGIKKFDMYFNNGDLVKKELKKTYL